MSTVLKTLGLEEVAALLQRSKSTVRSDASRRPYSLPPRLLIPGSKALLWLEKDVEAWLRSCRTATRK